MLCHFLVQFQVAGRHRFLDIQMQRPRGLKGDGCFEAAGIELLCPLLVSGHFTAALGQQGLLGPTWGFWSGVLVKQSFGKSLGRCGQEEAEGR